MKYYNVENYVRYKLDLEQTLKNMERDGEIVYNTMVWFCLVRW